MPYTNKLTTIERIERETSNETWAEFMDRVNQFMSQEDIIVQEIFPINEGWRLMIWYMQEEVDNA